MASFMDKLRAMAGFGPKDTLKKDTKVNGNDPSAFEALSAKYLACEDEAQKEKLWSELCRALPGMLFLAAMRYEGEDPNVPVHDRELHATVGAKRLYALNQNIVTRGNAGYRLAKTADDRRFRLCTLVSKKTKEEWVLLFTDFTRLIPDLKRNYRLTLISFAEVREIAKAYKGIVINPGEDAIVLDISQMNKMA